MHTVRMVELPTDPELSAEVRSADLGVPTLDRLGAELDHVVITPVRRLDSGVGVYPAETVFLVKELRGAGLNASYLDPPERRTFEVHESAVADLVTVGLSIAGSLTSNAAWLYIERLLTKVRPAASSTTDTDLEVTVVDPLAPPESNQLVLRGKPDVVLRAARKISEGRTLEPPTSAGDSE